MTNLKEQFYQTKNIEFLKKTLGRELWVQVSGSKDINGASAAFWAALMPVENIDEAYRDYSWNSYIGTQCPGFIEYGDKITYEANPLNFDNIATDARLSTNAVKRDFLCAFTQPEISDLKFKSNFKQFVNTWREQYQWDLFLPLSQNDEYNFKTLHLPITDGQEEFDHLVLSLVKTMIDSLNEKEIVKQFKNPTDLKGGISKLEYWLSELNFPDYQQQIKFLRNLQELRSTGTGHRKGKGYEKAAGVFGLNTDNYVDVFDRILLQANAFILFLAKNFLKDWTVTLS